jgi:SpoVK/Ycf46/Vps4 family AAA+-type ATPase
VVRRAVAETARLPREGDATAAIDRRVRATRDLKLAQHARRIDRLATWDQVVLPADLRDTVRELIARVRHHHRVFEEWGMERVVQTSRGLTVLFQGPPGTGKTLVAGLIARELGLELHQIDLSRVTSKWLGETERNLAAIFDAADEGQVVLLFDEADALFAKRTAVRSSNDRYANLEVDYLLQRLDAFEGIAILTSNHGSSIDPAFKRRMSFRLTFPVPDEETRELLWRAHLPPELPLDGTLDLEELASRHAFSGGCIRRVCLRAAFLAAADGAHLGQRHLERAVALDLAETGKLSSSGGLD